MDQSEGMLANLRGKLPKKWKNIFLGLLQIKEKIGGASLKL